MSIVESWTYRWDCYYQVFDAAYLGLWSRRPYTVKNGLYGLVKTDISGQYEREKSLISSPLYMVTFSIAWITTSIASSAQGSSAALLSYSFRSQCIDEWRSSFRILLELQRNSRKVSKTKKVDAKCGKLRVHLESSCLRRMINNILVVSSLFIDSHDERAQLFLPMHMVFSPRRYFVLRNNFTLQEEDYRPL